MGNVCPFRSRKVGEQIEHLTFSVINLTQNDIISSQPIQELLHACIIIALDDSRGTMSSAEFHSISAIILHYHFFISFHSSIELGNLLRYKTEASAAT